MLDTLRTLRLATWLGWQLETNWASPWLFALYTFVKPICGSLMLVCMFFAADTAAEYASKPRPPQQFLPFLYVSNACYGLVGSVMFGLSYAVVRDREHYRMLKYVYISPAHFQTFFLGRGLAQTVEGIIGGITNICVGLLLFSEMRTALGRDGIAWDWLAVYLFIGAAMFWACGMIIAAAMLNMSRSGMFLSEGVAGLVYLLSGVLFPISMLGWAENISLCLPTTYWLEGMRRALMGPLPESAVNLRSELTAWSHTEIAAALAVTSVALMAIAQWFWRWSERRAWRLGKLEENSGV